MKGERIYPDEPVGGFPSPPLSFEDAAGRDIEIRAYDPDDDGRQALVDMYTAFDPSDRAQGIPPTRESEIENWLDTILSPECLNVVAWHGDQAVGHATLVPDNDAYELAIFVLQDYQEAGIGTRLIRGLLGHGADEGVEKVWLTVERWNQAAVSLYKKIGFEVSNSESFELEMSLLLETESERENNESA